MKKKHYILLSFIANLAIAGSATSCFDQAAEKSSAKPSAPNEVKADTIRRNAIRLLASRLRWYHEDDLLEAAKPGSTDGEILDIGKKRFVFKTRKALRADLNRVLDSLRRTGPLVMGNISEDTDTVPYKGPSVRGKMIRVRQISN